MVYSCQLEEFLLKHLPEVFDCTVVGIANDSERDAALAVGVEPLDPECDRVALEKRIQTVLRSRGVTAAARIEIVAPGWNDGLTGKKLKRVIRNGFNSSRQMSADI